MVACMQLLTATGTKAEVDMFSSVCFTDYGFEFLCMGPQLGTSGPNLKPDLETLHSTVINLIFALLLLFTKCLVEKPLVAC